MYRVREFAQLAGVTVRALHHYDRLGLLRPARHPRNGYRVYRDADFARLEQIVVLKFVGVPLREIGRILKKQTSISETLRRQRCVLAEKRRGLDAAIAAIERAERSFDSGEPEWEQIRLVIKEIEMQNDTDWTKKYYSDDARARVDARRAEWTPELQARVSQQWTALIADIEAAIQRGENPASDTGQSLAARWHELLAGFTDGDPAVQRGLNRMWADRENWPEGQAKSFRMPAAVTEFIMLAGRGDRGREG